MVNDQIAPADAMFVDNNRDHDFAVGESAIHCVKGSMLAARIETFTNILDLPSGHGRVLRQLKSPLAGAHCLGPVTSTPMPWIFAQGRSVLHRCMRTNPPKKDPHGRRLRSNLGWVFTHTFEYRRVPVTILF
jgi:hypothetical protein